MATKRGAVAKSRRASKKNSNGAKKRGGATTVLSVKVSARKPHRDFAQVLDVGAKALDLAEQHRAQLEPRLDAGLIDGLQSDGQVLTSMIPTTTKTRTQSKSTTLDRNEALGGAHRLITAIRFAVTKSRATGAVRLAYGVGTPLRAESVPDVSHGAQLILDRASEKPEEPATFGILTQDTDRLAGMLPVIDTKAAEQRRRKMTAPQITRMRNEAANRILFAVDQISARGALAFHDDAHTAERFLALIGHGNPHGGRGTKKSAKGAAKVPATQTSNESVSAKS